MNTSHARPPPLARFLGATRLLGAMLACTSGWAAGWGAGWVVGAPAAATLTIATTTLTLAAAASPAHAAAQGLPVKRAIPPPPAHTPCPDVGTPNDTPPETDREEADRLVAQASQAAILGEHERARELMEEAAELDPTSEAVAFQLARSLEQLERPDEAADQFCRYLELAPDGPDRADAQARLNELRPAPEDPVPASARAAFQAGVEFYDDGDYSEAIREFSRALVELPGWAPAHFNRGLAYLATDRQRAGLSDLEEYLALDPSAPDRRRVQVEVEQLAAVVPQYSPSTTLISGLVVPGMGHFYTGRPGLGALVLATAGGSAAVGIFYTDVEIDCLSIPENGRCPPSQVADERTTRPLLVPGLAAAGVVTVLGALHAARGVRSGGSGGGASSQAAGGARADPDAGSPVTGLAVELPGLDRSGTGMLGSLRAFLRVSPSFRPGDSGVRSYLHLRF